ncbi:MAG TPA: exodeoxyribonuclease III [bacterium]|nr:exodeoxyribonuclease III [bacterium]
MAKQWSIVSWNVNSLRVRLPALERWLAAHEPLVACLQETKVQDELFPVDPFTRLGYHVAFHGQKTYNGVAILSRVPLEDVRPGFDGSGSEEQKRLLAATVLGVRVVNAYVPNGSEVGSPKFAHKLQFLADLRAYCAEHAHEQRPLVLVGDFNVAPEPQDVFDPQEMENQVCFHPQERAALAQVQACGLIDVFRKLEPGPGHYTWWDYRQAGFRRNRGLRIDHVWATPALAGSALTCWIDKEERAKEKASDHAPLMATFERTVE